MGGLRRRAAPAQDGEEQARKALARTAAMLRHHQRSGLTMVAIEDVLSLLDPAPAPPADPRADPLTGCLPAVARQGEGDPQEPG
jgi:hypothetical protein